MIVYRSRVTWREGTAAAFVAPFPTLGSLDRALWQLHNYMHLWFLRNPLYVYPSYTVLRDLVCYRTKLRIWCTTRIHIYSLSAPRTNTPVNKPQKRAVRPHNFGLELTCNSNRIIYHNSTGPSTLIPTLWKLTIARYLRTNCHMCRIEGSSVGGLSQTTQFRLQALLGETWLDIGLFWKIQRSPSL